MISPESMIEHMFENVKMSKYDILLYEACFKTHEKMGAQQQ